MYQYEDEEKKVAEEVVEAPKEEEPRVEEPAPAVEEEIKEEAPIEETPAEEVAPEVVEEVQPAEEAPEAKQVEEEEVEGPIKEAEPMVTESVDNPENMRKEETAPAAPKEEPIPDNPKPSKGKKGLGVVFSIISFLFGLPIWAAELCGMAAFVLLILVLVPNEAIKLPQELINITYGLSGCGIILGAGAIGCLVLIIIIMIFSKIAKKKTDCPKGLAGLGRTFAVLSLIFWFVLLLTIVGCVVYAVVTIGPENLMGYVSALMGGGAE